MSVLIIGTLIATVVALIFLLIRRRFNYFSDREVEYIKPTLKSTLKSFLVSNLESLVKDAYMEKRDSGLSFVGMFHTFLTPSIVMLDPQIVERVLIKDFSHFHDHGFEIEAAEPLTKHLFNLKGDEWRTLRHKLLPTFTTNKLKGMVPLMEKCAHSVVEDMKQEANLEVNFKPFFRKYTLSVIASCVYGIDPDSIKDPNCEFRRIMQIFVSPGIMEQIKLFFFISFPSLAKLLKMNIFAKEVNDFFMGITKEALEMRKTSGVKMNDFVQLLLELKEKGSVHMDMKDLEDDEKDKVLLQQSNLKVDSSGNKLEMTDELLAAQAFVFIVGGFDNTAYIISITMYMLSKHKDIQQRVREEVKQVKAKHGGINYLALRDMKLLESSINEALRMNPPLIFLGRMANKTYTYSNGQTIKKGMQCVIPNKLIQNDSKFWPNPEQFMPDRFLTDRINPGTYMPFGDGPRICIAQRLAILMAKTMIAETLETFEVLPSSKTQEPLQQNIIISPDIIGGLWGSFNLLKQ